MGALVLTRRAGERLVFTDKTRNQSFILKVMHFTDKNVTVEIDFDGKKIPATVDFSTAQELLNGEMMFRPSRYGHQVSVVLVFPSNIQIVRHELLNK